MICRGRVRFSYAYFTTGKNFLGKSYTSAVNSLNNSADAVLSGTYSERFSASFSFDIISKSGLFC